MLNKDGMNYNFDKNLYGDAFIFTIETTTENETFTLPLVSGGTFDCLVNWGDNSQNTITAYNDANATHTYATAGTYTIQIIGTCTKFAFNNGGDKAKVRKILNVADLGFTQLNFYGCSGLTEIVRPFRELKNLTDFSYLFYNSGLTAIPNGFLKNNSQITTIAICFTGCQITSIPSDLFRYNTSITNFGWCFAGNPITSIPSDLFRYNTVATHFMACFQNCSLLSSALNGNTFQYNVLISDVSYCFQNCSGLTGDGWQNIISQCETNVPEITKTNCFSGCTGLTGYPASIKTSWGGTLE